MLWLVRAGTWDPTPKRQGTWNGESRNVLKPRSPNRQKPTRAKKRGRDRGCVCGTMEWNGAMEQRHVTSQRQNITNKQTHHSHVTPSDRIGKDRMGCSEGKSEYGMCAHLVKANSLGCRTPHTMARAQHKYHELTTTAPHMT